MADVNGKVPAPRDEQPERPTEAPSSPSLQEVAPAAPMMAVEEAYSNNDNGGYYNKQLRKKVHRLRQLA